MKLAKKLSIATAGIALGFASVSIPSSAQAAQLFDFNYSFSNILGNPGVYSASGTLTTTDLNPTNDSYTITGITGTRTDNGVTQNILGLLPPGSFRNNNNLLYANAPFLDLDGLSFTVNGNTSVNVYYSSLNQIYTDDDSTDDDGTNIHDGSTFNVTNATPVATPVPEPTTIAGTIAFGTYLVMAGLKKRKHQQAS